MSYKHLNTSQAKDIANAVIAKVRNKNYAVKGAITNDDLAVSLQNLIASKLDAADLKTYTIKSQTTPEEGYFATYQLFEVAADSTETGVGAKINIPKDFLVKSGTVSTVTAADKEEGGKFYNNNDFAIGDKYIDLVVNVKSGTATDEHLYINVKDLVDTYTAGNGIEINASNGTISAKVVAANGLSVSSSGIAMAVAVADTWGGVQATGTYVAGTTYYTSAACTTKVDTSSFVAGETDVSSYFVYAKTADGTNGAFTSAEKFKLSQIDFATDADITALINSLDAL